MTGARSRVATVLVSSICVLAVVLGLLTATSTLTPAVAFAQTGHWVVNTAERAVVHVDSGTAQVDARVELPADAGEPLFALQGERQGFVVARDRVAVFGRSTLTVDTTIPVEFDEVPVGIETVGGPYLVYPSAGTIVRLGIPPLSLPVGGPVERPVWTDDGTVWLHRPDSGSFCALRAGADALDCSAGTVSGEPGGLSITGDLPAFVGTRRDAAQVIEATLGAPVGLGADVAEAGLLADRDTEGRLAVVEPGLNRLVLTDSGGVPAGRAGGAAIPVELGAGEFTSPVASRGVIAVLDIAANRLLTFDTAGRLLSTTDLPPGSPPRLTRGGDGTMYVDDAGGASTHVIGVDGTVTSVATGGLPPASVAIAAPPERRSPVAPPPTFRERLDMPDIPGSVPPVLGGPALPAPGGPPSGPSLPLPLEGVVQPPQPIVNPSQECQVLGAVQDLSATAAPDSTVNLAWSSPDAQCVGIRFAVQIDGREVAEVAETTFKATTPIVGQKYELGVRAVLGDTTGPVMTVNATAFQVAAASPFFIEGQRSMSSDTPTITVGLYWEAPDLRGGQLKHYLVEVVDSGGVPQRLTTTDVRARFQVNGCGPLSYSVRAVTTAVGSSGGPEYEGEVATANPGAVDCRVSSSASVAVNGTAAEVTIRRTRWAMSDSDFGVTCAVMLDGIEVWNETCLVEGAPTVASLGVQPPGNHRLYVVSSNDHGFVQSSTVDFVIEE